MKFKVPSALLAVATLSVLILGGGQSASAIGQHQWGAAYLDWVGSTLTRDTAVSQKITILNVAPSTYWNVNWVWDQESFGGYAGVQKDGQLQNQSQGDIAIFSLWNASDAAATSNSWCLPFGGEGEGMSCRAALPVNAGDRFDVKVMPDSARGSNWWRAEITVNDSQVVDLGSIKASKSNLRASRISNFIEYFGAAVNCDAVGNGSARFGIPISANNVRSSYLRFSRPIQGCVNSWLELDKNWGATGPILRFGGSIKAPSNLVEETSIPWLPPVVTPTTPSVPSKPQKFSTCAALNRLFPGGIAQTAKYKNLGTRIKLKPMVNLALYRTNKALDKDRDGIVCEK